MNYFNYFSEIEELFIRRRGRNLLLSPLDWALIETWQEREIPLHIILRSIEKVFDGAEKSAQKRTIKSLLYCKEEIEAQYAEWLERQVGKTGSKAVGSQQVKIGSQQSAVGNSKIPESNLFSDDAMSSHLERVSVEIKSALNRIENDFARTLSEVLSRLAELKGQTHTAESLEESLEKLDALVDASLLRNYETEKLAGEVEKQIASYKTKMEREVYQRTFDLMLLKRLREKAEIPRLSLFYL